MDVKAEIKRIIEHVKLQPNSIERNKTISHLYDAQFAANGLTASAPQMLDDSKDNCTCPAGAIRVDCPVHSSPK